MIPAELYEKLESLTNDASHKVGRTVSVDELANACLEEILSDPVLLEETLKEARRKRQRCP